MTDQEMLNAYIPMVKFIAQICGSSCEVVLHDISHPEKSLIAVENGFHSGRTIGAPLTEFAMSIIESQKYKESDFLVNYSGVGKGKNFISSTYFIKNEGRLIGMLCVNRDATLLKDLENLIQLVQQQYNLVTQPSTEIKETLDTPITEMLQQLVRTSIHNMGVPVERMNREEKTAVIRTLKDQGILSMKGAVTEIARQLNVSEPTVYRYIKSIPANRQIRCACP